MKRIAQRIMKRVTVEAAAGLALTGMLFMTARYAGLAASGSSVHIGKERPVVVLDSGHGGNDPGKVGVDKSLEKDINLAITLKLKEYLEQSDVKVILTREDDRGLYTEKDHSKKAADMKKRCQIIEAAKPEIVVSIHQNSYHEEYVKGAQVFYYATSQNSKRLADIIQEQLKSLDSENHREAKGNDSYFLLKKTSKPIVIVEYCVSDRQNGL